jgi:hypothetical protein
MTSRGHQLEMAHSAANDAVRAVAMQHGRIASALPEDEKFFAHRGFRQEVDLRFLVLALRWLREACGLAAGITQDRGLIGALHQFDSALPAAQDMRDVGEHLRDYLRGRGDLQRPEVREARAARGRNPDVGRQEALGVRIWEASDDGSGTRFEWAGIEIDVDRALRASEGLYASLRDAMERWYSA